MTRIKKNRYIVEHENENLELEKPKIKEMENTIQNVDDDLEDEKSSEILVPQMVNGFPFGSEVDVINIS